MFKSTDGGNAKNLNRDHSCHGERERGVEVGVRGAENRHKHAVAFFDFIYADSPDSGQESHPIVGDDKNKNRRDKRKILFCLALIADNFVCGIK